MSVPLKTRKVLNLYDKYVMATYTRVPIVLTKGSGCRVWDIEGKEYLDFFPGWAVSGLGHCHTRIVKAIRCQVNKMIHISNNYYNHLQAKLARELVNSSFDGKVFFCNSGAEANESAIKLARKFGNPARYEIITMENSFHGRTLATITATGQTKYQEGFEPLPLGFKHIKFNDLKVVKDAVTDKTVAIMIEPIQGEGGINVADKGYLQELRRFCDEKNLLLILDEVQTGMGRTGKMFCYQHYGIEPDIMTLAKTLGGGVPIGAMVVKRSIADILKPGSHASTFGGSPIVCAAALAVFETIRKEDLLKNAEEMGKYLREQLEVLKSKHQVIKEVRGIGLMLGVELTEPGKTVVEKCIEKGLLINCTHEKVLRLMPPIIVAKKDIDNAIGILDDSLKT